MIEKYNLLIIDDSEIDRSISKKRADGTFEIHRLRYHSGVLQERSK